jgi:hypothetical protein
MCFTRQDDENRLRHVLCQVTIPDLTPDQRADPTEMPLDQCLECLVTTRPAELAQQRSISLRLIMAVSGICPSWCRNAGQSGSVIP